MSLDMAVWHVGLLWSGATNTGLGGGNLIGHGSSARNLQDDVEISLTLCI
jgi:hypothetical protein